MEFKNGFEFLMAIKDGKIQSPAAMAQTIPMRIIDVQPGHIKYAVTPDERHLNLQGLIHGGFCATVLDTATGGAVHTTVENGVSFATLDLNVKMIRPLQKYKTYIAIGDVINMGRNILTSEARIVDESDKVYAFGSATLMITNCS